MNDCGIAVITGGFRSGKSSLLKATGERLFRDGVVGASYLCDLQIYSQMPPADVISSIAKRIDGGLSKPSLIAFDEIGDYLVPCQLELLEETEKLRDQGHKVILSVIGDLYGNSPAELPKATKDKVLKMTGGSTVTMELFSDDEIRAMLSRSGQPVFTDALLDYLTQEAGGHSLLAKELAMRCFTLLKHNAKPHKIVEDLRANITFIDNYFVNVVENIIAAGFDPLTWQWAGNGKKPNVEIYQNMIPRPSSSLFREWLSNYMKKRKPLR